MNAVIVEYSYLIKELMKKGKTGGRLLYTQIQTATLLTENSCCILSERTLKIFMEKFLIASFLNPIKGSKNLATNILILQIINGLTSYHRLGTFVSLEQLE